MVMLVGSVVGTGLAVAAPTVGAEAAISGVVSSIFGGVGAATSAATTSAGAAAAAGTAGTGIAATMGPIGWMCLGTTPSHKKVYTYDCWKSILRETDPTPSRGMTLLDVALDPRVRSYCILDNRPATLHMTMTNIWDEEFEIQAVRMPYDGLAAHAVRI